MDAASSEDAKLIPVYGFLEGDTLGLLLLGYSTEKISELAQKLCVSAAVRVKKQEKLSVKYHDRILDGNMTLLEANIEPLDRIDVVFSNED